ncbi:MAG: chemotaxis protein CheW [bacterium]|nr:MAG: chemotaxis protein CheW [bacterium]
METDTADTVEKKQYYILFSLAGESFTINVKYVLRVLEATSFTKVPQGPSFLKGIINFNGNVLPVVDTYLKFGLPAKEDFRKSLILVLHLNVEKKETDLGILVDGSNDVFEVHDADIKPYPATGNKYRVEYIDGVIERKEKFILILNPQKLFEKEAFLNVGNTKLSEDDKGGVKNEKD